jgi:hypothetical protein
VCILMYPREREREKSSEVGGGERAREEKKEKWSEGGREGGRERVGRREEKTFTPTPHVLIREPIPNITVSRSSVSVYTYSVYES